MNGAHRDEPDAVSSPDNPLMLAAVNRPLTPYEQRLPIHTQDLRSMLDEIRSIRHACDLDLMLFFVRHPCALLTSEQLFTHLGYGQEQAADSLDSLVDAGFLTRSQGALRAVCLYLLGPGSQRDGPLAPLLQIAAAPGGRQRVMRLLESGPGHSPPAGHPPGMAPTTPAAA